MSKIALATKIPEIERRVKDVSGLIRGMSINDTSSLLCIPTDQYVNWSIGITFENSKPLRAKAREAYSTHGPKNSEMQDKLMAKALEKCGLDRINAVINKRIGEHGAELLVDYKKHTMGVKTPFTTMCAGFDAVSSVFEMYESLQKEG